jgi:RimJ/RimL family protein N-acetyltransferase
VDLWREGKPESRGFWLGRKFWGQGLMTEAVEPVIDHAFDELGFEKLIFSNALGNERSRRIKEKTGARLLGVEPAKFVDPQFTQHELWELEKADWVRLRASQRP